MENKVTEKQIDKIIQAGSIEIQDLSDKTTLVKFKTEEGFEIYATSSCVDPKNYNRKVGAKICMDQIKDKLWEYEGYILSKNLYKTTGESHVDRVYSEAAELKVKLEKLQDFMGSTEFDDLSYVDQYLLIDQECAMSDYLDVLTARLSAISERKEVGNAGK